MSGVKVRTTTLGQAARSVKWLAGWVALAVVGLVSASPVAGWFVGGLVLAVVALSAPLWSWVRIDEHRVVVANGLWRRSIDRSQITAVCVKTTAVLGPVGHFVRSGHKPLRVLAFGARTSDALVTLETLAGELNVPFEPFPAD